ncbi:helix-turn-helix domain-containing protein [Hymenobacter mucosus]|uniref:Helix-turn-helix domain-containing protein n=1 Tax=Hymenobacter mucosus TaxID=1411120 RepID=A0A238ZEN7_9BACT|nr:AraC family transcriptional regulator [Hymenobacter mucosus]SNR81468.1 Helix-turn-helix domain-containing protein [Hymenobacter mucosus]
MENSAIPTFTFNDYPHTLEPTPQVSATEALEQLVVHRREDKFATCRQHIERHRRHFYKLSFFDEGGGFFYLNDEVIEVAPQSVLLVKPGVALSWRLHDGAQTGLYSFFSTDFYNAGLLPTYQLNSVLPTDVAYIYHPCSADEYAQIRQTGEQFLTQQHQLEKAQHYLRLLLADIRCWGTAPLAPSSATPATPPVVSAFLQLVETRLATGQESVLLLESYADDLCLDAKYLSALCRQATGQSAAAILREKVLTEAKVLLTGTHLSVGEIAHRLGFYDPAHFSRWFKQLAEQAPSAYRQQFAAYK